MSVWYELCFCVIAIPSISQLLITVKHNIALFHAEPSQSPTHLSFAYSKPMPAQIFRYLARTQDSNIAQLLLQLTTHIRLPQHLCSCHRFIIPHLSTQVGYCPQHPRTFLVHGNNIEIARFRSFYCFLPPVLSFADLFFRITSCITRNIRVYHLRIVLRL